MGESAKRGESVRVFAFCLFISAAFLMVCSKSSFLYPLNDWVDANIYFTIGKGMMRGYVPYARLYDQKGPVAFLLYGLASLVSGKSFFGVYLLETLTFALFLLAAYRILRLYAARGALLALPILAFGILSSLSFAQGGSLEELCMPVFAWSLYDSLRYFKTIYPKPVPMRMLVLNGLLAGVILCAKFNLLAFHFAWMVMMLIAQFCIKEYKRAVAGSIVFLGMMAAVLGVFCVYFAANGALADFFRYYFYENLFGYSYLESPLYLSMPLAIIKSAGAMLLRNLQYTVFIVLGIVWLTTRKRAQARPVEKANLWLLCALTTIGVYCGGQGYRYYALALAPFAIVGFAPLMQLWDARVADRLRGRRFGRQALLGGLCLVCFALAFLRTDNRYLLSVAREDTPQARFASIMERERTEDETSLFCYACPDGGFYLAADVIPKTRFFALANVSLPELAREQGAYFDSYQAEFVVTRNRALTDEHYCLLEAQTFQNEGYWDEYRLYQRIEEEQE